MNIKELQIPPPMYWQQFEDLCLSVFREAWADSTAQENGRLGQPQHGTDIWGTVQGRFVGVQCKGKDVGLGSSVNEDELRKEVEKAKAFTPALTKWTLATTAPKDASVEEVARQITAEHQAQGLFEVRVLGWGDLISLMSDTVFRHHFPDLLVKVGGNGVIVGRGDNTIAGVNEGAHQKIEDGVLRRIANDLLVAGSPPTLLPLFPYATGPARRALEEFGRLPRTVTEMKADTPQAQEPTPLADLLAAKELHHLVLGAPGSGKTHALWHIARSLLDGDGLVPLFLPIGRLETWDDATRGFADVASGVDVPSLLRDPRVCVVLDGWSEFASGQGVGERAKATRVLSRTRVIANGRHALTSDSSFHLWKLNLPPLPAINEAIKTALPVAPPPAPGLIELLKLPLALSLFILLGGGATARGQFLSRLHDHLSRDFPAGFREALAAAVASVFLSAQRRSYSRLENELRRRAALASIADPSALLRRLGTLEDRADTVVPVHDLYWSWLAGLGLLAENKVAPSVIQLATRESYELALESGALAAPQMVTAADETDVTLAALLTAHLGTDDASDTTFLNVINAMLADKRLPIRCRAALGALRSRRAGLLRPALMVLTEIRDAQLYVPAFDSALIPAELFTNRGVVAGWLGANGTDQVINAISDRGDAGWGTWLHQMANEHKLTAMDAVAAALACEARIPDWTVEHLPALSKTQPWKLQSVANRGTNREFANWLAEHYEVFVEAPGGGGWFHLNAVLVACGDDTTFQRLLQRFPLLHRSAQETLGFAITNRGEPWIGRFQKVAFASGAPHHHHKLAEHVSLSIDDATARRWIADGPTELGWRVLIARYGTAIVPEMVALLPSTFDGIKDSSVLAAMRFLPNAPESLVWEILKRIRGQIQPKPMQDAINALARVRSTGVPSIIGFISNRPDDLPTYHVRQSLQLLIEWEKETHVRLRVRSGAEDAPFAEWILLRRLPRDGNDHSFQLALAAEPDLAARAILGNFRGNEDAVKAIVGFMKPLTRYHEALFDFLIPNSKLAALALKAFAGAFETFPETALLRTVDAAGIEFDALLRALATSSSPAHPALHKALITKLLARPLSLFDCREVAKIVRVHPTQELSALLNSVIPTMETNQMWLVREIEIERGELLINEAGHWL